MLNYIDRPDIDSDEAAWLPDTAQADRDRESMKTDTISRFIQTSQHYLTMSREELEQIESNSF